MSLSCDRCQEVYLHKFGLLAVALCLLFLFSTQSSVCAQEKSDSLADTVLGKQMLCDNLIAQSNSPEAADFYSRLDSLNRKILLQDVEIERFNINFRQANNVQGRWRGPRYFLSTEGNAGATLSGLIAAVDVRERPIRQPYYLGLNSKGKITLIRRAANRIGVEDSIYPQLVGQCIGVLGSSVELGINLYHDHQARAKGFAPKTAILHVEKLKANLNQLFAERNSLLAAGASKVPESHLDLARDQGIVLEDLSKLAINEYATFHIAARRFRAFQDSLYVIDVMKNGTGAVGNIVALYATAHRRGSANAPAGILTTASAALVVATPIFSRLIGKCVEIHAQKQLLQLSKPGEQIDLKKLEVDHAKLAQTLQHLKDSEPERDLFISKAVELDSVNELSTQEHQKKFNMATREIHAGTRSATENVAVGTVVGGTKFGPGIGLMVSGFRFWKNSVQTNILICNGNLAYMCGTSLSVVDNVRIQVRNEYERRKLGKDRLLPGQILSDHMKRLDEIEHMAAFGTGSSGPH